MELRKFRKRLRMPGKRRMRKVRKVVGICAFSALATGAFADPALGQQPPTPGPLPSRVPVVEAIEVEGAVPAMVPESFEATPPGHPPIHTIPSMPMPAREDAGGTRRFDGPGVPVSFDLATREETVGADPVFGRAGRPGPDLEGGYPGFHGGQAEEQVPARFGDMRWIPPDRRRLRPWSMNAKIVLRYGSQFFLCSGTMVDAEVVLTAGHCVYDDETNAWADAAWVYPGWDGAGAPDRTVEHYGAGIAAGMHSITGWTQREDLNYDIAARGRSLFAECRCSGCLAMSD